TTLGQRRLGDHVNLEIDTQTQAVVDTVERVMAEQMKQHAAVTHVENGQWNGYC
ncbi:MAG: riboflavin synthase, partial [Plesiomonas shigelloides]